MLNNRMPIIIDCDPGVDDAIAIMVAVADPRLEILGMTTVAGNVNVDLTTHNAQLLKGFLRLNTPLAKGANAPLNRNYVDASYVHGKDGLGGYAQLFDEQTLGTLNDESAVELLERLLEEASEPVTIVAVGPLTNIAHLVTKRPDLKPKIKQLSIMGGGIDCGNRTPFAEFNFYVDPDAAQVVFQSGIPIMMAGLNMTEQAYVTPEDVTAIKQLSSPTAQLAADIIEYYSRQDGALHDPLSILALTHPQLFEKEATFIAIKTEDGAYRGMSYKVEPSPEASPVDLLIGIDRSAFIQILKDALSKH